METKGAHLKNEDTEYKQRLFSFLTTSYKDQQMRKVGELALESASVSVVCDLVFDEAWRGQVAARFFL